MSATVTGLIVVDEWRRNARETIRLTLEIYQGSPIFNFRVWYRDDKDGEMKPGRFGVALSTKHLERSAAAFRSAIGRAAEAGMPIKPTAPVANLESAS